MAKKEAVGRTPSKRVALRQVIGEYTMADRATFSSEELGLIDQLFAKLAPPPRTRKKGGSKAEKPKVDKTEKAEGKKFAISPGPKPPAPGSTAATPVPLPEPSLTVDDL